MREIEQLTKDLHWETKKCMKYQHLLQRLRDNFQKTNVAGCKQRYIDDIDNVFKDTSSLNRTDELDIRKENEELKNKLAGAMGGVTVVRKRIWIIFFELYTDWVAANSLEEALSYFHEEAQSKILKAERSDSEITYKY